MCRIVRIMSCEDFETQNCYLETKFVFISKTMKIPKTQHLTKELKTWKIETHISGIFVWKWLKRNMALSNYSKLQHFELGFLIPWDLTPKSGSERTQNSGQSFPSHLCLGSNPISKLRNRPWKWGTSRQDLNYAPLDGTRRSTKFQGGFSHSLIYILKSTSKFK